MSQTAEPGAVFDAHVNAEFVQRNVDATMVTMTDAPYVTQPRLDRAITLRSQAKAVGAVIHMPCNP